MSLAHDVPVRHLSSVADLSALPVDHPGRVTPDDLPQPPSYVLGRGDTSRAAWVVDYNTATIYVNDQLGITGVRNAMAEATASYFTSYTRPQLAAAHDASGVR